MIVKSEYTLNKHRVICIHIGARAHYLIPKALYASGNLYSLITDTWIARPFLRRILAVLPLSMFKSLAGRYTDSIPSDSVSSFGLSFLIKDVWLRLLYPYGWKLIEQRDLWFEQEAVRKMKNTNHATAVFGISYTALSPFQEAKKNKMKTILFQVDPGPEEERIVMNIITRYKHHHTSWEPAPETYWKHWKEECILADMIMVNSQWSKTCLMLEGIPEHKMQIIPLPYELTDTHHTFKRVYPESFSADRPLRCLFLGTLALRKGIHLVLESAEALLPYPVEFVLVGRSEIASEEMNKGNVHYKGVVAREETDRYYQEADLLLFPTLSDGFGLTQLEAMAWQLPVITTDRCGDVVMENHNGWRIDPSDASDLIMLIKHIILQPAGLKQRSGHCLETVEAYNTTRFAEEIAMIL